ncbi:PTS glucitol/sorbitol transporter subunit IIC [[Clostridium] innocuum]|nr:PTS glucitol/sorbitol transporter subunit IIC [[Clostridium] innocuum]MCR0189429.1 PTS glucitol/sorbitol transporter subunit IIC [[Clostridium] innocuum]MCR0397877.1 PTS glucitol/sorbitol transporter subunit IIC [[Clostridium] innocuum]
MGMDAFTDLTQGFLSMFETGGEILLGWMTTILPMVVCLMTAVSAVVKLIGESRVERITKFLTRWRIARYTLLPLMAILFLGNPLCFTFGKFLDEKYKTAYYDACVSFLHPVTGLFPHANAAELFVYMGIASGITQQKLSLSALATRYFCLCVIKKQ